MPPTLYLANKWLNMLMGTSYTAPSSVYLALFTTATTSSGGGTEVSGGSYARTAVSFTASTTALLENSGTVTFPTATGAWGTVTNFALFDASSGGNMLWQGALSSPQAISSGQTPVVSINNGQFALTT